MAETSDLWTFLGNGPKLTCDDCHRHIGPNKLRYRRDRDGRIRCDPCMAKMGKAQKQRKEQGNG